MPEYWINVYPEHIYGYHWQSKNAALLAEVNSILKVIYRIHVKFKSPMEIMNNDARKRNAALGRPLEMF